MRRRSTRSSATPPCSSAARARPRRAGARHRAVPARAWDRPCPSSAEHLDGDRAHREDRLLGRPRRRLRPRRAATRRWSAGSRPTSASPRPSHDLLDAGLEVHVAADAVGSRTALDRRAGPGARWSARAPASPPSRWRCSSCSARPGRPSSRRSRSSSCEAQQPGVRAARGRRRASTATPAAPPGHGHRRGRLHDRHVRLPGVDDRPLLRRPADHLHLPPHRQLRRQRQAMESDRVHARAAIMRAAVNREDAPGAERGWLDWLERLRHAGDHRRGHPRARAPHPRRGRDARRRLPGRRSTRPRRAS